MTRRRPRTRERGLSESVQWAVLAPAVVLCLIGVIQAGVLLHARNTVRHAAMAAAEAQALSGAGAHDAEAVVARMTARADVRDVRTTVIRGGGDVQVTVTGRVDLLLGLGHTPVRATAAMPVEAP